MIETIIAAIVSFAGTNIDDMFVDMLYFSQAQTKRHVMDVVVGKYLGIGFLVAVSALGALFAGVIPENYIRFLGIFPMALGIKAWLDSKNEDEEDELLEGARRGSGLLWSCAAVTVANGADNIGVYIPLFAGYSAAQMAVVCVVYAVMTAIWCLLGYQLANLPVLREFLEEHKEKIVPIVLIALGVYILFF